MEREIYISYMTNDDLFKVYKIDSRDVENFTHIIRRVIRTADIGSLVILGGRRATQEKYLKWLDHIDAAN